MTFRFLEEQNGLAPADPWFRRMRDAYLEPWGHGRVEEFDARAARRDLRPRHRVGRLPRAGSTPAEQDEFDVDYPVVLRRALARIGV